jgi:hypothetical protein
MNKLLAAAGAALLMTTPIAMAQPTYSQSTTTVTPAQGVPDIIAPTPGTLSTSHTEQSLGTDGTQTKRSETTYGTPGGVVNDSVTRTTSVPPPVVDTTRKTTTVTQ